MTLENVEKDVTIPAGCIVEIHNLLEVSNNATLTIEKGARIQVDQGVMLYAGVSGAAKLMVNGTEAEPVVFTSGAVSPAPGDWTSLYLGANLMGGTLIDHAVFEYAGSGSKPAIEVVSDKPDRISITNTTFQNNSSGAILNERTNGSFAQFTDNTMQNNGPWAVMLDANIVGTMGAGNTFGVPIRVVGSHVTLSATWMKYDAPYWLESIVTVDGANPVLTLESGIEIQFGMGMGLRVGAGSLVASQTTFTSSATTPSAGDWEMIWFGAKSGTSLLDGCTIAYGGTTDPSWAVLTIDAGVVHKVTVRGTTFHDNLGSTNIHADGGDCSAYENATPPNTFDLTPCE